MKVLDDKILVENLRLTINFSDENATIIFSLHFCLFYGTIISASKAYVHTMQLVGEIYPQTPNTSLINQ